MCWHEVEKPYPVDYISFGPKEEMKMFWNLYSESHHTFAERQLIENYCHIKQTSIQECLNSNFYYFLDKINEEKIDIFWIKKGIVINEYIKHKEYRFK